MPTGTTKRRPARIEDVEADRFSEISSFIITVSDPHQRRRVPPSLYTIPLLLIHGPRRLIHLPSGYPPTLATCAVVIKVRSRGAIAKGRFKTIQTYLRGGFSAHDQCTIYKLEPNWAQWPNWICNVLRRLVECMYSSCTSASQSLMPKGVSHSHSWVHARSKGNQWKCQSLPGHTWSLARCLIVQLGLFCDKFPV